MRVAVAGAKTVLAEASDALLAVSPDEMSEAARLLVQDRRRRWFWYGQGRSGLVASMAAMRLMHVGFTSHAVGETTAPALASGDGLVAISATGETPITLHVARLARDLGAHVLGVTSRADSALPTVAQRKIVLPTRGTAQFGGTLFEQTALLLLDVLVLDFTAADPQAYASMQTRHANLQ